LKQNKFKIDNPSPTRRETARGARDPGHAGAGTRHRHALPFIIETPLLSDSLVALTPTTVLFLNLPHYRFPARSPATPTSGAAASAPTRKHGLTRRRFPKPGEPHRRRLAEPGEPHRRHHRALAGLPSSAPRTGAARRRRARGLLSSLRALRGSALRLRRRGG
jgi:hypothetical protein